MKGLLVVLVFVNIGFAVVNICRGIGGEPWDKMIVPVVASLIAAVVCGGAATSLDD